MPLPKRRSDESHDEFIDRCMKDPVMVGEFPDANQRLAVCQKQAGVKTAGFLSLVSEPGDLLIEAAAEGQETADGKPKLPRFSMVAYTGGPMRITGWRYPVIVDLAGLAIPSQNRPIRFGHDMQSGVGHTDAIQVQDGKLLANGVVSRDTGAAREIVSSARNGFPWQASLGAAVEEFEFVRASQKVIVNGREFVGPVNVVRKAVLGEISFVDLGADGQTSASVAAAASQEEVEEPVPMDQTSDTNTETAAKADKGAATDIKDTQKPAETQNAGAQGTYTGPTAAQIRAEALAESNRIAEVRQYFAGRFPELEARGIREGWDRDRCELETLRTGRPKAPAVHFVDNSVDARTLEAACLMASGLQRVEELFDDQTLDAAHRRFRGSIGLQELLLEAAWANGFSGKPPLLTRFDIDIAFKVDLLYVACLPEAQKRGIADIEFAERLEGEALYSASEAFLEALSDFFQKLRRTHVVRAIEKQRAIVARAVETVDQAIASHEFDERIEKEFVELGESFASLLQSPESDPNSTPSES